MISYPQALERILQHITQPLPAERLQLTAAAGRILATNLVAPHDMPPFDQAMMDGYTLRSRDTQGATPAQPVRLALGSPLTAGAPAEQPLRPQQARRIMTGAPVPAGADTVIKMEESEVEADALIVRQPLCPGSYVQQRGAEIQHQTVILQHGARLTPQRIGTALALGLDRVDVVRQPRVALVAPGDELLLPGAPLQPGKKWCSNLYALELRAQEIGCASVNLGIVPDTLESLTAQLERGLDNEIIVILGASGRGDHDFAAGAMAAVGAEVLFRGVATNPGRSITVAQCQQTLIFGLPGSPWAAYIGFETFVWPAIRALLGQQPALPNRQHAMVTAPVQVRSDMTHFVPVRLQADAAGWRATPLDNLLSLAQADAQPLGLLVVSPASPHLAAGAIVEVQILTPW